ncbi:MAG: adenosylcobinamide-GDP ribazoletransferase [Pseudomonadota bacterium]
MAETMQSEFRREIGRLAIALGFFSRFPLPSSVFDPDLKPDRLDQSALWFPVAGLLIGIIPALIYSALSGPLPAAVAAGLAIAAGLLITGALHEDGLSDCSDGFGAARDPDKILEIMRDSRIGTYGAASLIFSIGLRWAALASLGPSIGAVALLVAHMGARGAITTALAFSSYARSSGAASTVEQGIDLGRWVLVLAVTIGIAAIFGGWSGIMATLLGLGAAGLVLIYARRRIDGYTGDVLGAMEQIAEIVILIVISFY